MTDKRNRQVKNELEKLLTDIDQLSLQKNDQYQDLSKVLHRMLYAFNCDRAWGVYPCDPESEGWAVPIEITRPEWGGVYKAGLQMPLTEADVDVINIYLKAKGSVTYGKDADYPLPEHFENVFMIK